MSWDQHGAVLLDPRHIQGDGLHRVREAVRLSHDIELPPLRLWNDRPCGRHAELDQSCLRCGIRPRRHQRVGITWLYLSSRAGLFDSTGLGKTIQVAGMLALMAENGELDLVHRAMIIARAATITQWKNQLARMIPDLLVTCVTGDKRHRAAALGREWEVALVGPEMLVSKTAGGAEQMAQFGISTVICDDVEALKNVNKTWKVIRSFTQDADRVVVATATPLDKRLTQLYDLGMHLDWGATLGSREDFQHRYVQMEQTWYTPRLKPVRCRFCRLVMVADHHNKAWVESKTRQTGPCSARPGQPHLPLSRVQPGAKFQWVEKGANPQRAQEFRQRIAPLVLRRLAADCDDMSMPAAEMGQVWLDLSAKQKARYEEIRKGVLTRLDATGNRVSRQEAQNWWLRAWQVTSSLSNLDGATARHADGDSSKLDWVTEAVTGDLDGEPLVVYCYFRPTLASLAARLDRAGVKTVRIWGEQHASEQDSAIRQFNDGQCNVMLITDAGGTGLNLQRARRMILVDTPRSAGRVAQIIGRIVRDGSAHQACYITQLLTDTPVEKELAATVGREAVMSAMVLDGGQLQDAFAWADDPEAMMRAVTG